MSVRRAECGMGTRLPRWAASSPGTQAGGRRRATHPLPCQGVAAQEPHQTPGAVQLLDNLLALASGAQVNVCKLQRYTPMDTSPGLGLIPINSQSLLSTDCVPAECRVATTLFRKCQYESPVFPPLFDNHFIEVSFIYHKFTFLKCAIQWFLVYSLGCTIITTI